MSAIAGRVLIIPRGNYTSTIRYYPLDLVWNPNDLNAYICKKEAMGIDPTNTTYWQLFSMNGITDTQWATIQSILGL